MISRITTLKVAEHLGIYIEGENSNYHIVNSLTHSKSPTAKSDYTAVEDILVGFVNGLINNGNLIIWMLSLLPRPVTINESAGNLELKTGDITTTVWRGLSVNAYEEVIASAWCEWMRKQ